MPEAIIEYQTPETLQALKDIGKYFGFTVIHNETAHAHKPVKPAGTVLAGKPLKPAEILLPEQPTAHQFLKEDTPVFSAPPVMVSPEIVADAETYWKPEIVAKPEPIAKPETPVSPEVNPREQMARLLKQIDVGNKNRQEQLKALILAFDKNFDFKLPVPAIMMNDAGGIRAIWRAEHCMVALDIEVDSSKAVFHATNLNTGKENLYTFDLTKLHFWKMLNVQLANTLNNNTA